MASRMGSLRGMILKALDQRVGVRGNSSSFKAAGSSNTTESLVRLISSRVVCR
jgi:hypothetical protein